MGLIIVETPAMEWPLADEGDRRLRVDNDKYKKDIEELAQTIHAGGIPCIMQFYHRGGWGGIYHTIARRIAASPVTFPSVFDVHEDEPPEQMSHRRHRVVRRALRRLRRPHCRLRVRRGGDPHRRRPPVRHLPFPLLEPPRRPVRGAELGEPHPVRPRGHRRRAQALRDGFHIQVFINGLEFGVGDLGLSLEENKHLAQIWQENGVDSLHVRSHWVGMHQGSYLSDTLFYPEPHIPVSEFPKEMDWTHYGQRCNLPLAAEIKKVVNIPVMTVCGFDAASADQAIAEGKTDFVGFNRRLFADAQYADKMRTGRALEVQPCTKCGHCSSTYNVPRHCRINACFGTESYDLTPLTREEEGPRHRRRPGRHAGGSGSGLARP